MRRGFRPPEFRDLRRCFCISPRPAPSGPSCRAAQRVRSRVFQEDEMPASDPFEPDWPVPSTPSWFPVATADDGELFDDDPFATAPSPADRIPEAGADEPPPEDDFFAS